MEAVEPPKRTLKECDAILTAPGQQLELGNKVIFGRPIKIFKNLPPTLRDFWLVTSDTWADREYIVLGSQRLTYRETHRRAVITANMLASQYGIRKGSKFALVCRNSPEWVYIFWAAHLLGAVIAVVNCWLTPEALVHCIKISDSVLTILDEERSKQLAPHLKTILQNGSKNVLVIGTKPALGARSFDASFEAYKNFLSVPQIMIDPDDDATLFFTSGTTGMPKAVLSTQRMVLSNLFTGSVAARRELLRKGEEVPEISPDDPQRITLLPVPLFHVTGCVSTLIPSCAAGAKVIMMHRWSTKEGLRIIREEGVTSAGSVPFIAQELMENAKPGDLKTMLYMSFGGAPAQAGVASLVRKHIPTASPQQSYGLTETNAVCCGHAGADYILRPESTGLPSLANEFRIVGEDGVDKPTGQIGEVWIRGPNVFKEYYNDPKATKEALTPDGWFKSGDLGSIDEEGFIYIRDRAKDIIIRGGENISAQQVEDGLYKNPNVQDCAVVGVTDRKLGELPAAVVVVRPPATETEESIIADARKHMPKHMVPAFVMLVSPKDANGELRLERNANGKIVKKALKTVVEAAWQERQKTGSKL